MQFQTWRRPNQFSKDHTIEVRIVILILDESGFIFLQNARLRKNWVSTANECQPPIVKQQDHSRDRQQVGQVVQHLVDGMLMARHKVGFGLMEVVQSNSPALTPSSGNSKRC